MGKLSATQQELSATSQQQMLVRTEVVPNALLVKLGLDPETARCVELSSGSELYNLCCSHLVSTGAAKSFTLDISSGASKHKSGDSDEDEDEPARVAAKDLGLGVVAFTFEKSNFFALHQTLGEVVGTNCGPAIYKSLVLIGANVSAIDELTRFCDMLIAKADTTSATRFSIYKWHVQYSYWRKTESAKARPIESVVLPSALKSKLVEDMSEFISPATRAWYVEHGVPYKRSYLLHGSPGAGKTSVIQALAGKFRRNVCYFSSLSHPEMTDDNLKAAVQRVPARSILVLEDVDALFSEVDGRRKRAGDKSALTFSGVLNALDGVGASTGQIFILTTNHRERLDPALIRCGRVDVHIEFADATREQMAALFAQFYKTAPPALAEEFADGLCALLGEKTVSMAQLQHYFTQQRRAPAEAAAKEVAKVIEEAEAHGLALGAKDGDAKGDDAKEKAKGAKKDEGEGEEGEGEAAPAKGGMGGGGSTAEDEEKPKAKPKASKAGSKEVHVHVHVDS